MNLSPNSAAAEVACLQKAHSKMRRCARGAYSSLGSFVIAVVVVVVVVVGSSSSSSNSKLE